MAGEGIERRDLFRAAGAATIAMTASSYAQVPGANDRMNLGVIGCGQRGLAVMGAFQENSAVQVAAVCDVYGNRTDAALQKATRARGFSDHRKLLESGAVDAVLIATPDHCHGPVTIDALNAGKDVYVEKPLTLHIEEGPEIIKAVRVNNRVCQVGLQRRSSENTIRARDEFVRAGKLGKITFARTWYNFNSAHLRQPPEGTQTQPSNLDWARFLGPVRWRDWDPKQYFNFRAYLDFGGGQITDLFTHLIDMVHLFMNEDMPSAAVASGGIFHYKDGRTAPDTIGVMLDYPGEWTASFEGVLGPGASEDGIELRGTEGRLMVGRDYSEFRSPEAGATPVVIKTGESGADATTRHVSNFIDCIRSRQRPVADVLVGHRAALACHLGNLAYLEKRRVRFDPQHERVLPL